ncbi:unnamed protein product [Urochloa humidicola]
MAVIVGLQMVVMCLTQPAVKERTEPASTPKEIKTFPFRRMISRSLWGTSPSAARTRTSLPHHPRGSC